MVNPDLQIPAQCRLDITSGPKKTLSFKKTSIVIAHVSIIRCSLERSPTIYKEIKNAEICPELLEINFMPLIVMIICNIILKEAYRSKSSTISRAFQNMIPMF